LLVAHRGDDRQGGGRAEAADRHQAPGGLEELGLRVDLLVVGADARIEHSQLLEQIADRAACELGQALGRLHRLAPHRYRAQRHHHSELRHQPPQPVGDRGSLHDEPLPEAMHREQRLRQSAYSLKLSVWL